MFRASKTEDENIFKIEEIQQVQIEGNVLARMVVNSWLMTIETLENEIQNFQSEIDKRTEIINEINKINA